MNRAVGTWMKPAFFDEGYEKNPGVAAEGPLVPEPIGDAEAINTVKSFMDDEWRKLIRPPLGALKFPYIAPGATYSDLWDWDTFFVGCAVPDDGLEYAKGGIMNLLDGPLKDDRPSKKATDDGEYDYYLHPYPLRAQFAYVVGKRLGDFTWIEPFLEKILVGIKWYERATQDQDGFFRWQTLTGIDNNPSIYGRPPGMVAGVDLAVFHYREYRALARLMALFGRSEGTEFCEKAEALKVLMQTRFWDEIDGFFYDIDRNIDYHVPGRQKITWDTYLKFRNGSGLYPLWGGVATPEQAERLKILIMDEAEFLAPCGTRTHSRRDPVYNNAISGGPSNWQGPVWGLNTFLTAYGLARYGYRAEAREIAMRLIRTFAWDIRQNGCLHEYYHGDTGQPLIKPGFLDWNMLALKVLDDISLRADCTSQDLV
jgi:putative isomerase